MTKIPSWLLIGPGVLIVLSGAAISAQDKYTVQVPGGLALSDCRGYEEWTQVAASHPKDVINGAKSTRSKPVPSNKRLRSLRFLFVAVLASPRDLVWVNLAYREAGRAQT